MALETERPIDAVGWKLLQELQVNARLPYSELGRRVGLTAPAVAERLKRLEDSGVISGYHVELDFERLGMPLMAFVRVVPRNATCAQVNDYARSIPEVLECHRVTGAECSIMKVLVRSVEHLEEVIDRLMPLGETVTSVVLSSSVTHRVIGPHR